MLLALSASSSLLACAPGAQTTQATAAVEGAVSDLVTSVWAPKWLVAGERGFASAYFESWGPDVAQNVQATVDVSGATNVSATSWEGTPCGTSKVKGGVRVSCVFAELGWGGVDLSYDMPSRGSVTFKSAVASANTDPDPANNVASASTIVARSTDANLMLLRTKPPKRGALAGQPFSLLFPVLNEGPGVARGAVLRVSITGPANVVSAESAGQPCSVSSATEVSCALADLPAGEYRFENFVTLYLAAPGTLEITAEVTSASNDPIPADNRLTRTHTIWAATHTDVSVSVTDAPDPVHAGDELTYRVTVSNAGPDAASMVAFFGYMQEGVRIVRVDAFDGCSFDEWSVWCFAGELAAGASRTITVVVVPSLGGTIATRFESYNSEGWREQDADPSNDGATAETTVRGPQDPVVTQTFNEQVPVEFESWDECNARYVWLSGKVHVSTHFVYRRSTGSTQVEWAANYASMSGVAMETGEEYQASGVWRNRERYSAGLPQSFTQSSQFNLITQSAAPNLNVHARFRVTFDRDGVPATTLEHVRYVCN
jgi:uncharacterized repeat protein (TIGR01451 family)